MSTIRNTPRTYSRIMDALRNGRDHNTRTLCNNTVAQVKVIEDPNISGAIDIYLHGNRIVRLYSNRDIMISAGGWHTATTKQRINMFLERTEWGLYQENWQWFVYNRSTGTRISFTDGMILRPDGTYILPA